jgi:NAD(P)-dependent dehydrogenase (short-subunit alcohol dehydrogenase family)
MLRQAAARATSDGDPEALFRRWAAAQPIAASRPAPCGPADVADMILFLLSGRAAYVTGGEFTIDGGLGAKLPL